MKWPEFASLLSGIGPETPLGRMVSIRAEDDPDRLKYFSKGELKIRNDWRKKQAKELPIDQVDAFLESMKQAFIKMAGGVQD